MRASPSIRLAKARPSRPFPASISTRSCASRRSGRSARTIASPTARSNCRSPKARCARTSSRRGSRSTSIPTARTPSFMGPDASDATTATERSGTATMKNAPLNSARRRCACGRHGQASGLPTPPTGQQNQKKRTYDGLPKPDNFIRYRHKPLAFRSKKLVGGSPGGARARSSLVRELGVLRASVYPSFGFGGGKIRIGKTRTSLPGDWGCTRGVIAVEASAATRSRPSPRRWSTG